MPDPKFIVQLPDLVAALPPDDAALFARLFHLSTTVGEVVPPESMFAWIERHFGTVEAVRRQRIVKVTNRITLEGTLYNELRASRPMETPAVQDLEATIEGNRGDPFCKPLEGTPADIFGRLQGTHSITASNIAKYDGFHGLVIFDEHHPLRFTRQSISDALETGQRWAAAAQQQDPQAIYYLFMWNCLWKSGASILHGHAQTTVSRGMPYGRVEALRQAALRYRATYGQDYIADLVQVHRALGLTRRLGPLEALSYLTPIKEKEVLLVGPAVDEHFASALYTVLDAYVQRMGVRAFNVALYMHPLAAVEEDWSVLPGVLARIVDRGDLNNRTADVGAMELYAASVVSSDPFRVVEML